MRSCSFWKPRLAQNRLTLIPIGWCRTPSCGRITESTKRLGVFPLPFYLSIKIAKKWTYAASCKARTRFLPSCLVSRKPLKKLISSSQCTPPASACKVLAASSWIWGFRSPWSKRFSASSWKISLTEAKKNSQSQRSRALLCIQIRMRRSKRIESRSLSLSGWRSSRS